MNAQYKQRPPVVGVDIGGVIISPTDENSDTSFFSKNYLKTPAFEGAFESIRQLVAAGCVVHLVSKCGESVEGKSRKWLATHQFYEITGVSPEAVHFCRERAGKAAICVNIGATYFVDDRLEVLSYLETVPHRYLFCPREKEVRQFRSFLPSVHRVSSWSEVVASVLRSLESLSAV